MERKACPRGDHRPDEVVPYFFVEKQIDGRLAVE
jgi:hypothetical protein